MTQQAFNGFQQPETFGSEFNAQQFLIMSILSTIRTSTLVKVIACTNAGEAALAGTVDVQPMVNQLDGAGNMTPHGTIYKCLYSRLQGGGNAIIMDPQAGDIGVMIFSDRDTSKVIATRKAANPGSGRMFDMADGIYIGWCLNGVPTQYVQFTAAGINVTDKSANTIVMNSTGITVNGTLFRRDHSVWTDAEITAMSTHTVSAHQHAQPADGHGDLEQDVDKPFN